MSKINEFFAKQTIFLTGVTGFLGKVMLWKLLKEAGETIKIFVLVRASKDASAKKRLEDVFATKIFDELLSAKPYLKERVIPLEGDIMRHEFGLSKEDQEMLERETTLIIHSAATTKFTENLKLAVEMNLLGVQRMLNLAKRCKRLESVVHISTAYVAADKPNQDMIHEKIYPMKVTPYEIIERVANISLEEADRITPEVIGAYPNTYSFTKALAEHLVEAERGDLPLCMVRPAIVTAAVHEPLPGWIDVLLGPAGLFLATGMGALRVMRGSSDIVCDFIPVDICCNAILASAWRNRKLIKDSHDFQAELPIYHIATSGANPLKWLWPRQIIASYFVRYRPKRAFGYPFAFFCNHDWSFAVCNYLLHFLPAMFVDGTRLLRGKKTFMVRAATKLHKATSSLSHFTVNSWTFAPHTTDKMISDLTDDDKKNYHMDVRKLDWDHYLIVFCHGMRKYLLKEDDEAPAKPNEKQVQQVQESRSIFSRIMEYMRSYLVIISLGCLIYFFRQNFWIIQMRVKQIKEIVLKNTTKLLTSN